MSQQSQCGFLEEVMAWDKQTCLENLDSALPTIISKLEESAYIEESVGILKIICHSFLPCVPSEELEDRVFSHVCKLICGFIDGAISKITLIISGRQSTSEEVKSVVVECLEWLMDTASCVEFCVRHVLSSPGSVELSCVQSLPSCAVYVLKEAYTHCKNSTSIYGDLLEHIGESLSFLFKRTHSLQMAFVNVVDKICISGTQLEDHVQVLCSVCTGLFQICGVVTCLDVKLVISLWKALVKVCSQHISLLRDRFDVCPLISYLCDEIRQGYKYLFVLCPGADSGSLGDDKTFIKSSKILGFQMKVVVALLRDFTNYLGNCERNVLDLLLFLHRYLPPSLCAHGISAKLESEVRAQIVNATAPILGHLIDNRVFRSALTVYTEERTCDDRLPQLLIQLMVLDILPKCEADVIDSWLSPTSYNADTSTRGLLSAIFESVQQCEVEMRIPVMLPGVMVSGKPQRICQSIKWRSPLYINFVAFDNLDRETLWKLLTHPHLARMVSLYEHTATHVCGFIGACPAKHFSVLEYTFLENVLKDNHLSSLLAVDGWCYLARYGTASICRDQVQVLLVAFNQLQWGNLTSVHKLKCLIERLIKFMSPEHQADLVKQFSPHDDPHLWVALTSSCLNGDLAVSVRQSLIPWGLSVLRGTQMKALDVFSSCKLFTDILRDCSMMECMSPQQQVTLVSSVCNIWSHIQATPQEIHTVRQDLIARLLHLTKYLLHVMDTGNILMVLTVVLSSIKTASNSDVALAASYFLSGFGPLRIAPSFQHSQVLNMLPKIFNTVMTHPDPLVQHRAIEAFVQFARETVHEEIIPACVQGNETLSIRIEHLQNKVPYQLSQTDFVLSDYLKNQISEAEEKVKAVKALADNITGDARDNISNEVEILRFEDDKSVEGNNECSNDPPSKRARLSATLPDALAPHTKEVESEAAASTSDVESTRSPKYKTFLDALSSLAKDIELECKSTIPPPWFAEATRDVVTRISNSISPNSNWFDRLS